MTLLRLIATLIFTYVVTADALFLAMLRPVRRAGVPSDLGLFLLTRGAGPAFLSVVYYFLLRFWPHQTPALYVLVPLTIFGLLILFGRSSLRDLVSVYRSAGRKAKEALASARSSPPLLIALAFLLLLFVFGLTYPIVEHDSLTALIEARIMVNDLSVETFLTGQPDPDSGYYLNSFRTPFLQMLYVWFSVAGGSVWMDPLARTVSPVYALYGVTLLGWLASRRHQGSRVSIWAMFLLVSAPIFFYMGYSNGLDTAQLFLGLAALTWFAELLNRGEGSIELAPITGFFSGLALFSHLLTAPALGGAMLFFLIRSRWSPRKRLAAIFLIALSAAVAGAQFHYLGNSTLLAPLKRSITSDFLQELRPTAASEVQARRSPTADNQPEIRVDGSNGSTVAPDAAERITAAKPTEAPSAPETADTAAEAVSGEPAAMPTSLEAFTDVLEARGQRGGPISHLVFGRLQMFTGIEYFGIIFYLFWISAVIWLLKSGMAPMDKVLLFAALATVVVVLSGIRKISWSNPRYIGAVLPIAAYFAAPLMASIEDFLRLRIRLRPRGITTWVLVFFLAFPAVLVTSVRGAKVEITNPGTFYRDFRSLRWLVQLRNDPLGAAEELWDEYLGIRKTLSFFWADQATKVRNAHDYFAGVFFINEHTSPEARVLVFRDARFFYYGKRRGAVWYSPELERDKFWLAANVEHRFRYLCSENFTHILLDDYSKRMRGYQDTKTDEMLSNDLTERVYEFGTAEVYRLRCD